MQKLALNKSFANLTLIVSILLFLYWNVVQNFDMYRFVIVGALFEMTSIISVIAIFLILLFLIVLIGVNKLKVLKQFYFALLIFAVLITLLFTIYM